MNKCRICNSNYSPFISFGDQPIANGFLNEQDFVNEFTFNMEVGFCTNCCMMQLVDQPPREKMFHDQYAFFSSLSTHMLKHFKNFADSIIDNHLAKKDDPFVVELGSNDGVMLRNFSQKNIRHLGIEPSKNVAEKAISNGINTKIQFFDKNLANEIISKSGRADSVFCSNVLCHIPDFESIAEGIFSLLKDDGVFIFEDPYLGDLISKTAYDQIYDEHVFFFSVNSVKNAFSKYGFNLVDITPVPTHGGSMRYSLMKKGVSSVSENVLKQLKIEDEMALNKMETFIKFSKNVEISKNELVRLLENKRKDEKRVCGYGATSKSTTILNYCGIGPDLIEFICDTTPIKQGKFTPGTHIPVKSPDDFHKNFPDFAILFAWNHKNEIIEKERDFSNQGGKWITHVPSVHEF